MEFSKPIVDIIKARVSYRTYRNQSLEPAVQEEILKSIESLSESPFHGQVRIELIHLPELDPNEKKQLGTYGIIQGVQDFLVGAVTKSQFDLENYGFQLEQIILKATELNLGTVWLAGTFNHVGFKEKMNVSPDEYVPAVSPIGYATDKRRFVDKVMRFAVRSNNRRPWNILFFDTDFSHTLNSENAGSYSIPLEMVRLAPSAGNSQPWRILKESDSNIYHFYIAKKMSNKVWKVMGFNRIDMGIGTCHFDLTTKALNLAGEWIMDPPAIECPESLQYLISWKGNE